MVWNDESRNLSQSPETETLRGQSGKHYHYQVKLLHKMKGINLTNNQYGLE